MVTFALMSDARGSKRLGRKRGTRRIAAVAHEDAAGRSELVRRFLAAYEHDWKERWLRPGQSLESALREADGAMALTFPMRGVVADPQRLEGTPTSYRALLDGESDLELPFMISVGRASRVRWRENCFFFASHHDGHRSFAFQKGNCALLAFDEQGTSLGVVASSFDSFVVALTIAIESGGNKGADVGEATWAALRATDSAAKAVEAPCPLRQGTETERRGTETERRQRSLSASFSPPSASLPAR